VKACGADDDRAGAVPRITGAVHILLRILHTFLRGVMLCGLRAETRFPGVPAPDAPKTVRLLTEHGRDVNTFVYALLFMQIFLYILICFYIKRIKEYDTEFLLTLYSNVDSFKGRKFRSDAEIIQGAWHTVSSLLKHMSVNHGCRDILMSQKRLNGTDIRTPL